MFFCFSGDSVGDKSQPCLQPHHFAFSISSARCTWCGTRLNPAASLGDALCKKLVLALCVPAVPGKLSVVDHLLFAAVSVWGGWLALMGWYSLGRSIGQPKAGSTWQSNML